MFYLTINLKNSLDFFLDYILFNLVWFVMILLILPTLPMELYAFNCFYCFVFVSVCQPESMWDGYNKFKIIIIIIINSFQLLLSYGRGIDLAGSAKPASIWLGKYYFIFFSHDYVTQWPQAFYFLFLILDLFRSSTKIFWNNNKIS